MPRFVGFAEIVSVAGVVPLAGVTVSHDAEDVTVKLTGVVPATATVCAGGAGPFKGAEKLSCEGVAVNPPVTVNVTGIDTGLLDAP